MRLNSRRPLGVSLLIIGLLAAGTIGLPPEARLPLSGGAAGAQALVQRYRVVGVATREQRSAIAATGVAIEVVGPGYVEMIATAAQVQRVAALGFAVELAPRPADFTPADAAYHSYDEMVAEIQAVAAAHPAIVRLFSIGRSYEGRTLWAAKISGNVAQDEDEPEALFVGLYHAREHLTVEMMLYLLHLLADGYGAPGQEQITSLVDTRAIYLIFDLNPDGGEYDVAPGYYQFWRKNRQPNFGGSIGTDLNRNHSYKWGCCGGSSGYPSDETYRGPAPASAPEVQAIESFVNSRVIDGAQRIEVAITFHTYSELILWPYGHTYDDVPADMSAGDHAVFVAMGQAMAATNGYSPMQSSDLYISDGDFTDWAYGVHRIFAYTFEMYPTIAGFEGFYPSGAVIPAQTERNRAAVLYLLENAGCPYTAIDQAAEHCTNGRVNPPKRTWLPISR
ncbi:MAG TPA: M14 family metallopeptidase, partial [Roseiflexaceae bacterium]